MPSSPDYPRMVTMGATFRTTTRKPEAGRVRMRRRSARQAVIVLAGGAVLGAGIPFAWFMIGASAKWENAERYAALIMGSTASYLLLAAVVTVVVARLGARATRRQANLPWDRSLTEWRDVPGEFDHVLEEMLITAAAIAVLVCLALFLAVGL
jgi:hypothetical protein